MQSIHVNLPDNTPDDRRFWVDKDQFNLDRKGFPVPYFSLREASANFFGRSRRWLHYNSYYGGADNWYIDGEKWKYQRHDNGIRFLDLADIERLAHAIYQSDPKFDLLRLATTVNLVKYCALAHGYLDVRGHKVYGKDIGRPWKNSQKEKRGK